MISKFVDYHAKGEVRQITSYIQDTPDLLRTFETENEAGPQPAGAFPVTVDVTALYTSIPFQDPYQDGGMQAFEKCMNNRIDQSVPTWYLMLLLEEVLMGNIYTYGDKLLSCCHGSIVMLQLRKSMF